MLVSAGVNQSGKFIHKDRKILGTVLRALSFRSPRFRTLSFKGSQLHTVDYASSQSTPTDLQQASKKMSNFT